MSRRAISADLTRAFWGFMCGRYGTTVVEKASAAEMRALGAALALFGVIDAKDFLGRYTTTLGTRIYPCFEVGAGTAAERARQVGTCVHEHVHVRQFRRGPFPAEYVLDGSKRALFEAEAYRATLEIAFWFNGTCPTVASLLTALGGYALSAADLAVARVYLTKARAVVLRGGVVTPEAKVAIQWLGRCAGPRRAR